MTLTIIHKEKGSFLYSCTKDNEPFAKKLSAHPSIFWTSIPGARESIFSSPCWLEVFALKNNQWGKRFFIGTCNGQCCCIFPTSASGDSISWFPLLQQLLFSLGHLENHFHRSSNFWWIIVFFGHQFCENIVKIVNYEGVFSRRLSGRTD